MLKVFFQYLIFPGLLFSACAGLIAGWADRKLTARLQWRRGPVWYQNFTDIIKLLGKETVLPEGAGSVFLLAPFAGLISAGVIATILGNSIINSQQSFLGDIIVVLYLMVIPALSSIIGASASRNPLASVGASREMKLVLAYELPFILSVIAVIIKCAGTIQFSSITNHQIIFGSHIASLSGALAFCVCLLCVQAKLAMAPFDIAEADQELMSGVLIEYSGLPLAVFKLNKALLLYVLPLFLIIIFWAGNLRIPILAAKYLAILMLVILIKNTNPRLRIDQALKFFWGPVTLLAIAAVMLALAGL